MRTLVRSVAAGVAATALVATSMWGMSSASAEVIPIDNAAVTGSLEVAGKTAALPAGASVSGTWDDVSGDLALQFTVPQGELVASVPGIGDVPVTFQLSNPGGISGTVTDGSVSATGAFQLDLLSAAVGPGVDLAPCAFGPIEMVFTGTLVDGVLSLSEGGFAIPGTEDACGGLTALINPQVMSEGNTAELVIDLGVQAVEPTTTTTEPVTTVPVDGQPVTTVPTTAEPVKTTPPGGAVAPATGARPVAGAANYTG